LADARFSDALADLRDPELIDAKIFEAETRLELALHYRIPYPRLGHVRHSRNSAADELTDQDLVPLAYMHSTYHKSDEK
jgi:hypothetical protein